MIHSLTGFAVDVVCCRYGIGKYQQPTAKREMAAAKRTPSPDTTASLLDGLQASPNIPAATNNLLENSPSHSS
jgi:hypothetical protein